MKKGTPNGVLFYLEGVIDLAAISKNQFDYLTNLSKGTGGNAAWAKSQLKGATFTPPSAPTTPNNTGAPANPATPSNVPPTGAPVPSGTIMPNIVKQDVGIGGQLGTANTAAFLKGNPQEQQALIQGLGNIGAPSGPTGPAGGAPIMGSGPVFTPPPQTAPQITPMNPGIPTMDLAAIQKYAEEQVARKLADARLAADQTIRSGQTTADQQLGSLQTQFDRSRANITEDRNLQNVQDARRLSPFAGNDQYKISLRDFARERTDREMQQDLASQQGNINQNLTNLQNTINEKYGALANAAPDERQRLVQEIKNDERQYELMLHNSQREDVLANASLTKDQFNQALQQFNANRGVFESDRSFNQNADQLEQDNARANAVLTGNFTDPAKVALQQKMESNSEAWTNASAAEKTRLHDENLAIAEQLGVSYDTGTGTYSPADLTSRTVAGQAADAQTKLIQQQLDTGQLTNEAAKYNLDQLKDPNSPINMVANYDAEIKKLELAALPEMQKQDLIKIKASIADIGQVHYKPQTQAEKDYDLQQVEKIKAEIDKIKNETNGKTLSGTAITVKESSDNYDTIYQDIQDAKDLTEAYTLIEQNVDNLTDADYKAAKAEARNRFN